MAKYAEQVGADGLLIITPYYNKTSMPGLLTHYKAVSENTSLPIILYNVPSRTGMNITSEACLKLSEIENIVAIKEASGNISQIAEIANICKNNLNIYSGNDDQILPVLSLGGLGVISVLSNIAPKQTHLMIQEFFSRNIEKATTMQLDSLNLVRVLFSETNPIPVKYALNLMGYKFGIPRLPLVELSENLKEKLKLEMKLYGIL